MQCKVVHADVAVDIRNERNEAGNGPAQHPHPLLGCRQLCRDDAALQLDARRQVGRGIQRDAVWPQAGNLCNGVGNRCRRLLGQAVDQVGVDGLETDLPCGGHQITQGIKRLDPVHGLLRIRVKVPHAKAEPVEAQRGQVAQAVWRGRARVHLDHHLGAWRQPERGADGGHQAGHFSIRDQDKLQALVHRVSC